MFELLVYAPLDFLPPTHKAHIEVFEHNDGIVFHHHLGYHMYNLTEIASFKVFNILYLVPVTARFRTISFSCGQEFFIICAIIAACLLLYLIKRHLLDYSSLEIYKRKI